MSFYNDTCGSLSSSIMNSTISVVLFLLNTNNGKKTVYIEVTDIVRKYSVLILLVCDKIHPSSNYDFSPICDPILLILICSMSCPRQWSWAKGIGFEWEGPGIESHLTKYCTTDSKKGQ